MQLFFADPSHFITLAAASNIAEGAVKAGADSATSIQTLYEQIYQGQGAFGRICQAMYTLAFLMFCIKLHAVYLEKGKNLTAILQGMAIPLILVILLGTKTGAPAKLLTYGLRSMSANIATPIISTIQLDLERDKISQAAKEAGLARTELIKQFDAKIAKCGLESTDIGIQRGCVQANAVIELKNIEKNNINDPTYKRYLESVRDNAINTTKQEAEIADKNAIEQAITVGFAGVMEGIINNLLYSISMLFYWVVELGQIITFYLLPVAMTMGIYDLSAIAHWIGIFWSLCNAKICFAIVVALVVYIAQTFNFAGYILSLLLAFFAPAVSYMFAKGGAVAIAEGLSTLPAGAVAGAIGKGFATARSRRQASRSIQQVSIVKPKKPSTAPK